MAKLSDIAPKSFLTVMKLVSDAGIDVGDWGKASNRAYNSEWSYMDDEKQIIVLCLWLKEMEERDGMIVLELNYRELPENPRKGVRKKRALEMDNAIKKAERERLPIRVIVCDGEPRDEGVSPSPSRVSKRLLDPISWVVTSYAWDTGDCMLTRGQA